MSWATLAINVLVALGGLAGFSAFFNLLLTRKKTKIETVDIEQNISDKVLKNLSTDNDILRIERRLLKEEVDKCNENYKILSTKMKEFEWDQFETKKSIAKLVEWAKSASQELHLKGSNFEPPPVQELIEKIS